LNPKSLPAVDLDCMFSNIDSIGLPTDLNATFKTFMAKTALAKKLDATINEIEHFEIQVTQWFDASMERLGSRFKRNTFLFTAIFATFRARWKPMTKAPKRRLAR
jgi:hypothetical protein